MIGIGTANIAAGFFQGFAVSTSGSRTAVAEQSGAKSQLTGARRRGAGGAAAVVLQHAAARPSTDGAGGRRDRCGDLAGRYRRRSAATAHVRKSSFVLSLVATARRGVLRRAGGHPRRRRAVDPAVLQAELVAPRRGTRP